MYSIIPYLFIDSFIVFFFLLIFGDLGNFFAAFLQIQVLCHIISYSHFEYVCHDDF